MCLGIRPEMGEVMRPNRSNGTLILSWSLLALLGSGSALPLPAKAVPQVQTLTRSGEYAEFLSEKHGIAFPAVVGQDDFLAALRKATGVTVEPAKDAPFDAMGAIGAALRVG